MAFGKYAAAGIRDGDGQRAAVLESKRQRLADQRFEIDVGIHGAFDAVQSGDRQPGVIDKALIARDAVANLANQLTLRVQISHAHILFDQLHHGVTGPVRLKPDTTSPIRSSHNWGRICTMRLLVPMLMVLTMPVLLAQDKTVDQGVYTSAQAARGAKLFESNCTMCHREPGGTAPVLAGERFTKPFSDATLQTLFTTIKTTMPRQAPGSLSDAEYVDLVAHLLKINSYADGMNELAVSDLGGIRIPGQTGSLDFALVQVVGCLAQNGRVWTLSRATEPVRTREPEAPKDDAAAQLDAAPFGERTFRLQQVYGAPAGWKDQRVVAKGFLTKAGSEERVNVTSMRTLTASCSN
jgi:cytochrome c5